MRVLLLCLGCAVAGGFLTPAVTAAEIGQRTLRFMDERRARPILTEVWYPTTDPLTAGDRNDASPFVRAPTVRDARIEASPRPLVLLSHGTGGHRLTLEWLAAGLVRRGYVVAAVDHWGNTHDTAVPEYFLRSWERPQDLSVALTELTRHPDFGPAIDPARVAAAGFSLGGYTVLALAGGKMDLAALYRFTDTPEGRAESAIPEFAELRAFMQQPETKERLFAAFRDAPPLADPRFRAVVALAPAIGQAFTGPEAFTPTGAAVLIVAAEADRLAPPATNAAHYHALIPGSRYELLRGPVGHFVFLNQARPALRDQLPALFVDDPACDRGRIQDHVINLAAEFLEQHLRASVAPTGAR